jgi:hypothetical protein
MRLALVAPALALASPLLRAAPQTPAKKSVASRPVVDAAGQRVTAALNRALRSKVSAPGGQLNIAISPTARAREGYFSQVVISARPAQVRKLGISELDVRARNVRIDVQYLLKTGNVRTLSSQTSLRAVVTEDDLTRLLARGKRTKDMGLRVRYIDSNRMRVTGNLNYTLLNGPISGVARLRLGRDYKVYLDILSLQLRGVETPQFVKDNLAGRINPVIDYQDVPFRPQFRTVTVRGTRATLAA